jgi:serine/threonine protein kinase
MRLKRHININLLRLVYNSWHGYEHKYSIEKKALGPGGNADVYKAVSISDGQEVAIKILKNDHRKSKEKRGRFDDEINVMLENYPIIDGILPVFDYSIKGCWYTMPIATPVSTHTKDFKQISDVIDGFIQLSETLIELHEKGLSHRDIKPDNIYFFNNRYCLGDFGIVDIPNNPKNLTKKSDRIGARFTIAPEMLRDSKNADGRKADVYSLAKTLWMVLIDNKEGFDGQYNFIDESISLHSSEKLREIHLVEIDELLLNSTRNSPDDRPSMLEFRDMLVAWKDTYANPQKVQRSNWNFIIKHLFAGNFPASCSWSDIDSVIYVLNMVSKLPAYNYMIFSDNGGLDFQKAERANEEGCIYVYATNMRLLVKPKLLSVEVFNYSEWNYFLLELEKQDAILDNPQCEDEFLVEDTPAHYVSAQYAQYGVYDYDSGVKFPKGSKTVYRYLDGKFLIVLKDGFYNGIRSVIDGRHGDCNRVEFREYMNSIKSVAEGVDVKKYSCEDVLNHFFNENPFSIEQSSKNEEPGHSRWVSTEFINENYANFCFMEILQELGSNEPDKIAFFYRFNKDNTFTFPSFLSPEKLYLCRDGYIRSLPENDERILQVYDRELAIILFIDLEKKLNQLCGANEEDYTGVSFSAYIRRIGKPTHLFSKEEIKDLMRNADDRVDNTLVIDENGYAQIVQRHKEGMFYPLRHETWHAGNVYVGKYSTLSDLDDTFNYSLEKWLEYLTTNKRAIYQDYLSHSKPVEELIKEINTFY